MVRGNDAARKVYDDILTSTGGHCPFCADLGHAKTLDHYLPKSVFPVYSVLPLNLIPCCRDCNSGKNSSFSHLVSEQTLHPYLDDHRFFDQRWLEAEIVPGEPTLALYHCKPPASWNDTDRNRVAAHFREYDIASRFSLQAGAEIVRVVELRAGFLRYLTPDEFQNFLLESSVVGKLPLNGWSRTLYLGLASADWFLNADFTEAA
jgi:hypothetical protein